jgi:hypothetical protein
MSFVGCVMRADADELCEWVVALAHASGCKVKVPYMQGYLEKKGNLNR